MKSVFALLSGILILQASGANAATILCTNSALNTKTNYAVLESNDGKNFIATQVIDGVELEEKIKITLTTAMISTLKVGKPLGLFPDLNYVQRDMDRFANFEGRFFGRSLLLCLDQQMHPLAQ